MRSTPTRIEYIVQVWDEEDYTSEEMWTEIMDIDDSAEPIDVTGKHTSSWLTFSVDFMKEKDIDKYLVKRKKDVRHIEKKKYVRESKMRIDEKIEKYLTEAVFKVGDKIEVSRDADPRWRGKKGVIKRVMNMKPPRYEVEFDEVKVRGADFDGDHLKKR